MKEKALWINQIKGLCICLVVFYHSVITFYPHLSTFQHPWSETLSKCWIYFNLYLAPFRMPVFFFISGFLIQRYIDAVSWRDGFSKRVGAILWVLVLWGVLQWQALSHINQWLAPDRDINTSANAAYARSVVEFIQGMLTASTSLWYLYALVAYFVLCKLTSGVKMPVLLLLGFLSIAINFLPTPWWGMNSVLRNILYYALGAWLGTPLMAWMKAFDIRRHWLALAGVAAIAIVLWFARMPLFLSLLSIFVIMKVFSAIARRYPPADTSLLNIVGSNTIAIYTTHRILIELFSLTLLGWFSVQPPSASLELTLLLLYPFFSLFICVAMGIIARGLSRHLAGDLLFSPPVLGTSRQ
ncbi:acyltransferase family protein [Enterobacteriaceae bacterium RIT691]|nr:acyltransferase family protein [Enterobacteriaceae bacterium RIT691]